MSAAISSQLHAQLEAVLNREPDARAVAIRLDSPQGLPDALRVRGRQFPVRWCESGLALREALCELDQQPPGEAALLVTPLSDSHLPADIAARLTRARVFQARDWEIARPLFGATSVDARLGNFDWIAQALIDLSVQGPYLPLTHRVLDLDTAWREFLGRALGVRGARPDAQELLSWTLKPDHEVRFAALPDQTRRDVLAWFERECGPVGQLVASAARAGRCSDSVALAMVCGVLFAHPKQQPTELAKASVRLERYLDNRHVGAVDGRRWAEEVARLAESIGLERLRSALERADEILVELSVEAHAHLSALTPLGLEQRLAHFAVTLAEHLRAPSQPSMLQVEDTASDVLSHQLANDRPLRRERVLMARRLARWLLKAAVENLDYRGLVQWQAEQGAFVDWARSRLLGGDELEALSRVYADLRKEAAARRDRLNLKFAGLLAQINRENAWKQGPALPLERVLEELAAPLAARAGLLVLVVDGLSLSIFRELMNRPDQLGWRELVPEQTSTPWVGVAALPTVTESSRTSLLCGALRLGTSAQEKPGFAAHPALVQVSGKKAPILFHKAELMDDTGLSQKVRESIADAGRRIVGVVYNAVDDHLSGPEQLHQSWQLEQLRGLLPLLQAARETRRILLVTSDHGHVLEDGSESLNGPESDRWRPASAASVSENELLYEGGRVVSPTGEPRLVCIASETKRYRGRRNGYHGGATLQEVCVPLSVFAPFGLDLEAWCEAPPAAPEWWDLPQFGEPAKRVERPRPARKPGKPPQAQVSLFDALPEPEPVLAATVDWIEALMASPNYAAQKQLAARVALDDALMRALLSALEQRGGKLGWTALAQKMRLPELRLSGALSAARRVLNLDQAPVLSLDEASRTVELNRALLDQQFQLKSGDQA
jgi:hypothetical protein